MTEPTPVAMRALLDRYDGILLDVYGVLTDARGPLPGAREAIAHLNARGFPYAIVTNDASRSQATYAKRFAGFGLAIPGERVVTSGSLLAGHARERGLAGKRGAVLGTADSIEYVRAGGVELVPFAAGMEIDALFVCDDDGFDFLPTVELALSAIIRALEAGREPALILPNPDLVYPKAGGELGITAGAVALLIEAALARRFHARAPRFTPLGKPERHLFDRAAAQLGIAHDRLVMIGDQLETDIAGARAAGVDAALLAGVSRWEHARASVPFAPRYLLEGLAP